MFAFATSLTADLRTPSTRRATCIARPPRVRVAPATRMGIGEDGLQEDLHLAREYIEKGGTVDDVKNMLTRLEQRRAILALQVTTIEDVMAVLIKNNLRGDRSLVAEAMEAALGIFSKSEDDYPSTGTPSGYTMDPLRKQPKF